MATPFVRAVRRKYPKSNISFLAHRRRLEVLQNNQHINQLIPYHGKGKKILPLLWKLRSGKFDMVIVLHANDPDIVPLVRWSGAPIRVGWGESKWAHLFTHTTLRKNPPEHFLVHKRRLLDLIDIPVEHLHTEIFLQPEDDVGYQTRVLPWLKENNCKRFVVMHPFGTNPKKWWPLDYFFSAAQFIFQKYNSPSVFVGDSESLNIVKRHPRFNSKNHLVATGLTIRHSTAIIQHAWKMLSTDSGPMHLAFAVKCPTLCLFGATDPLVHGPYFDRDLHRVIHRQPLTELTQEVVCRVWEEWVK
jgi:ADP-heptose:LPS heptosyltransferase